MKKTKKKLTFASSVVAAGAVVGLSSCGLYGPPPNEPQPDVYGPPVINEEEYDDPGVEVYGPPEDFVDVPSEPVYGPPPDDIDAPIETVYGPPEDFSYDDSIESSEAPIEEEESDEDEIDEETPEDFVEEPMVVVYGPPEP